MIFPIDRRLTPDEMRAWLDRKPPRFVPRRFHRDGSGRKPWEHWFDAEGNYLGNRGGALALEPKL